MSNAEVLLRPAKTGGGSTGPALPLEFPLTCFKCCLTILIFLQGDVMPLDVSSLASNLHTTCIQSVWAPRRGLKITFSSLISFEEYSCMRGSKLPWSSSTLNL